MSVLTEDQKLIFRVMADNLDKEIAGVLKGDVASRELSLAITKIEEAAMWIRRAIERD